jgi:hypothetical protein
MAAAHGDFAAVLRLMVAIDGSCEGLQLGAGPRSGSRLASRTPMVIALREHLRNTGTLMKAFGPGAVLRKWISDLPLDHGLQAYCNRLVYASAGSIGGHRARIRVVTVEGGLPFMAGTSGRRRQARVAVVPLLRGPDDLAFRAMTTPAGPRYEVIQAAAVQDRLVAGMPDLVAALEREKATHAVFPEVAMTEATALALARAMKANFDRAIDRGRMPTLRYAIAGVGGPRRNEAWLIDAQGTVVDRQHKLNGWTLDDRQQRDHGLLPELHGGVLEEDLDPVYDLVVFDDEAGGQRTIVLVCQDLEVEKGVILGPAWPPRSLAEQVRASIVAAPVLDGALADGRGNPRWAWKAAEPIAAACGCMVVVANSAVLSEKRRLVPLDTPAEPGIAIIFPPRTHGRATPAPILRALSSAPFVLERVPLPGT